MDQESETENKNMPAFTCLVLCAVVIMCFSNAYAVEGENNSAKNFQVLVEECAKQHGHTVPELDHAMFIGDVSNIKPCFFGCAFKKAGFLNDQGQYDLESGLSHLKNYMRDPEGHAKLTEVAKQCESVKDKAVSDGEAGCERGALAANCFMEKLQLIRPKYAN